MEEYAWIRYQLKVPDVPRVLKLSTIYICIGLYYVFLLTGRNCAFYRIVKVCFNLYAPNEYTVATKTSINTPNHSCVQVIHSTFFVVLTFLINTFV